MCTLLCEAPEDLVRLGVQYSTICRYYCIYYYYYYYYVLY